MSGCSSWPLDKNHTSTRCFELFSFSNAVVTAPIPLLERLRCGATLVHWAVRYAPNLAKDLVVAAASFVPLARRRQGIYNWE
jgi:hypothetical protein